MKSLFILLIACGAGYFAFDYYQHNKTPTSVEVATFELAIYASAITDGENARLNPTLINYIYERRAEFPPLPKEMSAEERFEDLALAGENLRVALSQCATPPSGRISAQQAMLISMMGHLSSRMLALSIERVKTMDRENPSFQQSVAAVKQMCEGTKTMLTGYLAMLFVEPHGAEIEVILLECARSFIPDLIERLPQKYRDETKADIDTLIAPRVKPHLKQEFDRVRALF